MHQFIRPIVLILGLFLSVPGHAQVKGRDTLRLTLKEAETQFLQNNLELIQSQFDISQARAEVLTAKLFDNPEVSFENIFINSENRTILDFSRNNGQFTAALSQLIRTAGKRNKNIQLAKLGAEQAELQFADLLRTLRYTLRSDFFKIHFLEQTSKVYGTEIESLLQTLPVFQAQFKKGNVARKEVLRIQSQLYTLQAELSSLNNDIDDVQSELKLLLRARAETFIIADATIDLDGKKFLQAFSYQQMQDSAYRNRADLKLAKKAVEYTSVNYRLQKALAVPDVTVSLTYDKQGNFLRDYNGLGISMPLPFFNRNQGAIKQAGIAISASKAALTRQQDVIQNELDNSYQSALRQEKLFNGFDPAFRADFSHLIDEVSKNYQKRNVSLLEFLDFYDSFKENTTQMNNLQMDYINALEQLNYVTATPFFNH